MLSFAAHANKKPVDSANLAGAHALGSDDVPLRAEITFRDGLIQCSKRAAGPAGLAILAPVHQFGEVLLETVRLQERAAPYELTVELARGRLMRINHKLEDWGLLDYPGAEAILEQVSDAKEALIRALQADSAAEASVPATEALSLAVRASESLALFHAESFLARRRQTGGLPKRLLGCGIHLDKSTDLARQRLTAACDFVTVPFSWRDIEPNEQSFNWKPIDAWVDLLAKNKMPMRGSALLSFAQRDIPDWLYVWEHDFDTIRDLAFEHVRRVINRYGQYIQVWDVISGIHAATSFAFNFEQLMELTRMTAALVKQTFPRATAIIEIVSPWGEYYARNQRTIPPLLYADMVMQSGVNFDGFGLKLVFGPAVDGMFVRDLFQISSQLDQFSKLSKPVHITAAQVPSAVTVDRNLPGGDGQFALEGGAWHGAWSEAVQAEWLRKFVTIALSKPFVESLTWASLADHGKQMVANGGLLRSDLAPKASYQEWLKLRGELGVGNRRAERS